MPERLLDQGEVDVTSDQVATPVNASARAGTVSLPASPRIRQLPGTAGRTGCDEACRTSG